MAIGQLTMHGVSNKVEIPFTTNGNELMGTLHVNRLDYGIGPDGGFMVGHDVEIEVRCVID